MSTSNPFMFAQFPLQQTIYDKTTGEPLDSGIIRYYTDSSMSTRKDVYEQSNAPNGDVTYTNIGSQLVLSGFGSFVDTSGANYTPFLFPYTGTPTAPGEFQSYFIYVTDSLGGFQFSVSDWPPNQINDSSSTGGDFTSINQITNPQFAETLFYPATTVTITVPSGTTVTPIAPGWFISTTGAGTVTLTQNALTVDEETNPPYSLTIATSGITDFFIYQRIINSPRLFATGAVAGFFEAASSEGTEITLTMTFAPSTGGSTSPAPTQICQGTTQNNASYNGIFGAATVAGPVNLESPTTGYVDIIITPSVFIFTGITLTSIQILPVLGEDVVPIYSEVSVPIQKSLNSYYWLPKLAYKPIPSYLIGWDWGLNPFQAQGTSSFPTSPLSLGGNTAYYIADQTILFQTVTNGFTSALSGNNLVITCAADSSGAVIQYVSPLIVKELLSQRMSVQINCSTTNNVTATVPVVATISLWWTAGVIPTITSGGSYASLFTAISSAGVPTPTSGWTQVPNTYPTQSFTVPTTISAFDFSGFDATAVNTSSAVNFAIAITFGTMKATNTLNLNYCSLVGGDIATRPAPQTSAAVLNDCKTYYQSSFLYGTAPAQNVGAATGEAVGFYSNGSTTPGGPVVLFSTPLRASPGALTLYNPSAANAQIRNETVNNDWSGSGFVVGSHTQNGFATNGTINTLNSAAPGNLLGVHWSADSRLGVI